MPQAGYPTGIVQENQGEMPQIPYFLFLFGQKPSTVGKNGGCEWNPDAGLTFHPWCKDGADNFDCIDDKSDRGTVPLPDWYPHGEQRSSI